MRQPSTETPEQPISPDKAEYFDLLIIGSGQGGNVLTNHLAAKGQTIALVERDKLGGSCVNYGCTPTKTLLASAHMAARARAATALGIEVDVKPDFDRIMKRVRDIRAQWRDGVGAMKDLDSVEILFAEGRFVAPRVVEADGRYLTADRILVDTGTSPRVPDIEGLEGTPYLTHKDIFDLESLPEVLAVVGGGYVGLELGQAMARLGSDVHIIESSERILDREAPNISEALQQALEDDGVHFLLDSELETVSHDGRFHLTISGDQSLDADALLIAAGRRPNTRVLNVEAAGVELDDDGFVVVDDRLRTSVDGVWAIGDCAGRPAFTHVSVEDAYRLESQWQDEGSGEDRNRDDRTLAYAVFTEPAVGRVGQATPTDPSDDIRVARKDYADVGRAVEWNRTRGFQELVVESDSGKILGATLVGDMAEELAQMLLPLIDQGITWQELARSTFVHPTYMESLRGLARSLDD